MTSMMIVPAPPAAFSDIPEPGISLSAPRMNMHTGDMMHISTPSAIGRAVASLTARNAEASSIDTRLTAGVSSAWAVSGSSSISSLSR